MFTTFVPKVFKMLVVLTGCLYVSVVTSCTYGPEEEYFKAIEEPDRLATISLNSYNDSDTVYLYSPTVFSFQVAIDKGSIKEVQVLFDGKLIRNGLSQTGQFGILEHDLLKTGVFPLEIRFVATTGSGSLADKYEMEYIEVWRKWIVKIDVTPPARPEPVLSNENGFLKLSWSPHRKPDFRQYIVRRYGLGKVESFSISDAETSFMIDEEYAGGYDISYTVEVETQMHRVVSYPVAYKSDLTLHAEYRFSDSTMSLTWDKADFAGPFKSYTIFENNAVTHEIVNPSDTSLRFRPLDVLFGLSSWFSVRLNMHDGTSVSSNGFHQPRLVTTAQLVPMQQEFGYNTTYDWVIGVDSYSTALTIYNTLMQPQQVVMTGSTNRIAPGEGTYAYYSSRENGIVQVNMQTGELAYINIMRMTTGGFFSNPHVKSASANQIVSFSYRAHNTTGDYLVNHVCVYDMVNNSVLYKAEGAGLSHVYAPTISADGKYMRVPADNKIYRVNGSTLEPQSQIPSGHIFLTFKPGNSETFLTLNAGHVYVFNTVTAVVQSSYGPPAANFTYRGFDHVTMNLLFTAKESRVCYAVDIETGVQQTINAYSKNTNDFTLISGYLFDYQGYYFKAIKD